MSASSPLSFLARWGLLVAVVLMGGALIATVVTMDRNVEEASGTLIRGQAESYRSSLQVTGRLRDAEQLRPLLRELLEDERPRGLRYIAVVLRGEELVDAGEPTASPAEVLRILREQPRGEIQTVGERVRVAFGSARPRRRGPPAMLLEFEPTMANALRKSSTRSLGLGGIVAAILLLMAIVLVRWVLLEQKREQKRAHDRRLASLGEMSAVLAHEIRNPLASLKGNAQLLVKMSDEPKARAKAERLVTEAERLEGLTDELLEFVRAGELERRQVDPVGLAREVAGTLDPSRIEIVAEGAPSSWPLDEGRMRQVLRNLLENALQAGEGAVVAQVGKRAGKLVFGIRDHGAGIAETDLPQIFEPFFTRKTRGTGLGLAVVRRIVERHHGTIVVENAEGGGARFTIELPRD